MTVAPGGNTDISSRHAEEHLARRARRLPSRLVGAGTGPAQPPAGRGFWMPRAKQLEGQGHGPSCLGPNSVWKRISRHKAE